jgi:serine/threonine-protein kinase
MLNASENPEISSIEFLILLEKAGVALRDVKAVPGETGHQLAQQLVRDGKLTRYQADALLARKHDDLVMGNYEILDKLGAGGMGAVYKARHRRMKRLVAIKVLSREVAKSETFLQRFQREVETIARLSHPNVVMAYDADESHAGPFLVMEFVDGRDLASEVSKVAPLSVADAVDCILQAACGLEYAHSQGIIHRDIKSANLMRDTSGVVKVADLGLARLHANTDNSLTQAGGMVGTADFMPPEQALDSTSIDHRADIYSLGCTLCHLLTGRPPYEGATFMAVLLKHRESAIPSLAALRPEVPPELEAIFRNMVAKKPEDRPGSMTEVVRSLEALRRSRHLSDIRPVGTTPRQGSDTSMTGATINFSPGDSSVVRNATASTASTMTTDSAEARKVAGCTVVLAEASRTQAGIVRRFLQQLNTTVVLAADGREALEVAARENARAIITSMHLADMTGIELARLLLEDSRCPHVGLVVATSESDAAEAAALLPRSHRVTIVPKPFDLQPLAAAIARTME